MAMGLSYATEWFTDWYSGERSHLAFLFGGPYAPPHFAMIGLNVALPQLLCAPALRRRIWFVVLTAALLNVSMWLERVLIIWNTVSHTRLPSMNRVIRPTVSDWALLAGTIGSFAFLMLCFSRLLPVVAKHDLGKLLHGRGRAA